MDPTITVITAVYNDEKFIKKSVESILTQTFRDFEYIVVDDGSTDKTLQILHELALRDQRLIILSQKNAGAAAARNLAIQSAKGTYIAIQDSDDISTRNRLETQLKQLSHSNGRTISCTGFYVINGADEVITSNNKKYNNINANILKGSFCACHPTMMFPKDLLIEAGGYNLFYNKTEDYDLILRLLENNAHIEKVNECLYNYRIREDSEGSMNNGAYSKRVYENHLNRIKSLPEDFSAVINDYKVDPDYIVKRHAHELFFSENYEGYRKFYLSNISKLPLNNFLLYFTYSLIPSPLKKVIKYLMANGIRQV